MIISSPKSIQLILLGMLMYVQILTPDYCLKSKVKSSTQFNTWDVRDDFCDITSRVQPIFNLQKCDGKTFNVYTENGLFIVVVYILSLIVNVHIQSSIDGE